MRAIWMFVFAYSLSFASEIISSVTQSERGWQIECQSARQLFLKHSRATRLALKQFKEGDVIDVKGSGVVTITHTDVRAILFADEREERASCDSINAIEIFAIPRSGSCYLKSLVQQNFPSVPVRRHSGDDIRYDCWVRLHVRSK